MSIVGVVGHSVGEIAAAVIGGQLSLVAGAGLAVIRGLSMDEGCVGDGIMLEVRQGAEEGVLSHMHVVVAAENERGVRVVSGPREALQDLVDKQVVGIRIVRVCDAFHNPWYVSAAADLLHERQKSKRGWDQNPPKSKLARRPRVRVIPYVFPRVNSLCQGQYNIAYI